jgi:hypothetical protein
VYSNGQKVKPLDEAVQRRRHPWADSVKNDPFTAMAVAAAAGFLVGGGARSHAGRTMLMFIGRIVAPGAAYNFVAGMVTGRHDSTRRADFQN